MEKIRYKKFTKEQEVIDLLKSSGSKDCIIEFSEFIDMNFDDVLFKYVTFNNCNFINVKFNECTIDCSCFTSCNLSCLTIEASKVNASIFVGCEVGNINVFTSNFINVVMRFCSLCEARLSHSYFKSLEIGHSSIRSSFDIGDENSIFDDTDYTSLGTCDITVIDSSLTRNFIYPPVTCPEEGSFIGFKKVVIPNLSMPMSMSLINDHVEVGKHSYGIAKLLIPAEAKRTSGTGRKCRANMAKVLDITSIDGTEHFTLATSIFDNSFRYCVGDTVEPTYGYDDSRSECASGIHFFLSRKEAVDYML